VGRGEESSILSVVPIAAYWEEEGKGERVGKKKGQEKAGKAEGKCAKKGWGDNIGGS